MSMTELTCCPGALETGYLTYCPACRRRLFGGKQVSHLLPYDLPQKDEAIADLFIENRKRISISGVQEKLSLTLDKNRLRLTHAGESGTYILKPIPRDLKKVDQAPANEHLTMQIARQVYKINTAENGLVFFKDGSPAYLTRRFDIKPNGTRWGVEDFATLAGMTKANAGPNFKYPYSYEAIGPLMQRFMPAWKVEIEKYFTLVLFNYTFSNGDAHLKNFSVMEGPAGDYLFSPAYDLINTRIHIDDTDFALDKKLFEDNFRSAAWNKTAHASGDDFRELGRRIGVQEKRIETLMLPFLERQEAVENLIQRSFLNEASKRAYLLYYNTRRNYLMGR